MDDNERMVENLLRREEIDQQVAGAMRIVKREFFVPKRFASQTYVDRPLPIGHEQTISAPSLVGFITKTLKIKKGMAILEVGAGSGYQAALLGALVGEKGHVYAIERVPELVKMAKENIAKTGLKNITVIEGDGSQGLKEHAPFDRIVVSAGAKEVPDPLIEQLKKGGRMLIPIGLMFWQDLVLVEKEDTVKKTKILPVMFVPLIGKFAHPEKE